MKNIPLIIILILPLCSCVRNNECKEQYQGIYQLNMAYFTDSVIQDFVQRKHWDTVQLISNPNGEYFIRTTDPILKECEGEWFVESDNIEGDCIGYVKQNNLKHASPVGPFIISVFDSLKFSIQFVKIEEKINKAK